VVKQRKEAVQVYLPESLQNFDLGCIHFVKKFSWNMFILFPGLFPGLFTGLFADRVATEFNYLSQILCIFRLKMNTLQIIVVSHRHPPGPYGRGYPRTPGSFTWARHARPFYALRVGHLQNRIKAVSGVACLQGRQPAAVFLPPWIPHARRALSLLPLNCKVFSHLDSSSRHV
jgi:hypothetical protein